MVNYHTQKLNTYSEHVDVSIEWQFGAMNVLISY